MPSTHRVNTYDPVTGYLNSTTFPDAVAATYYTDWGPEQIIDVVEDVVPDHVYDDAPESRGLYGEDDVLAEDDMMQRSWIMPDGTLT